MPKNSESFRPRDADRMERAASLVTLLVLGWAWTLQAVSVTQKPLIVTQEGFDLGRFMGKWYEVAVVSTCPHYMQRKRGNPITVALELQHIASQGNFTMTATSFRNGSCKHSSTDYSLTNTPGRFFHHVARFGADVDSFVFHTNYDEYAMILQLGTEKPSGNQTTTVKLYSRTPEVGADVLDDFKMLVRQQGMSNDSIIMNQNKGECAPGEEVKEAVTTLLQGSKGNVAPHVVPAQQKDAGSI